MANAEYQKYLDACASFSGAGLGAAVDLLTDTVKAALVRGYTPAVSTHQFLSDVTGHGGTLVATATLGTKTVSGGGVFNAASVTFPAVAAGAACAHVVVYKDTGTPSTSPLLALIDTATGLPVTPVDVDVTVTWDTGSNKVFKV